MGVLPVFVLRILMRAAREEERAEMFIVIRYPFAYLEKELRRTYAGQRDVQVLVDRRSRERRVSKQPVAVERRRTDRRRPKQELVEVVILA